MNVPGRSAWAQSQSSGSSSLPGLNVREATSIRLLPRFGEPRDVEVAAADGAHGGGDAALLADLFAPDAPADPLGRRADHVQGAWSVLTGIAANRAIAGGEPVDVAGLVPQLRGPDHST